MATQQAEAVIRRLYDALNRRDYDALDELMTEDYVHQSTPKHGMSLTELKHVMQHFTSAVFPDLHATVDEMIVEGDTVTVHWTQTATHQGEFLGIPATGKRLRYSGVNVFRLRDGRIASDTPQWDFSVIQQQLLGDST